MERDSRPEVIRSDVGVALRSPFAELRDAAYRWFVELWGDAATADAQLMAPYGIFGGISAIDLLRRPRGVIWNLPIIRTLRRRRLLDAIRDAQAMNRAGAYA